MRETTTTNCAQDNVRQWTESRNSEPSFNSLAQTKRSEQRRWLRQRRDAASAWAALKMQPTRLFCLLVKTLGNTAHLCMWVCVYVCVWWTKRKSQKQSTLIVFVLFLLIVGDASRRSFWSWVCVLVCVYVCKYVCVCLHWCMCVLVVVVAFVIAAACWFFLVLLLRYLKDVGFTGQGKLKIHWEK